MSKPSIQIYASKVIVEGEHQDANVWLEGVDYDSILADIPVKDVIGFVLENYHSEYTEALVEASDD